MLKVENQTIDYLKTKSKMKSIEEKNNDNVTNKVKIKCFRN